MRFVIRLSVALALLGTALVATAGPVAAASHPTITVTCTNGFERTVSAHAARGVAKSLTNFNAHRGTSVTCTAGPGAPRGQAKSHARLTIQCSNGFEKTVSARAARGITRALNAFNERRHSDVTCAIVP